MRVNNQVTKFYDHIDHSDDQYYAHEDGMVFSKYFTGNKYSLLENEQIAEVNEANVVQVDGVSQVDTSRSDTCEYPVRKVSVHSKLATNSPVMSCHQLSKGVIKPSLILLKTKTVLVMVQSTLSLN